MNAGSPGHKLTREEVHFMRLLGVAAAAAILTIAVFAPRDGWGRGDVSVGISVGTPPPAVVYPAAVYTAPPAYAHHGPHHRHHHRHHRHWDRHHHR